MPSFDMLDIATARLGLMDETVMFEAFAFFNLFFGRDGKMTAFFNSTSTTGAPQPIGTDSGQQVQITQQIEIDTATQRRLLTNNMKYLNHVTTRIKNKAYEIKGLLYKALYNQ
jgi:hypothetical protein